MFGSLFFINLIIYIESSISEDMASNAEFICNFFREKGWTTQSICGVLGNIQDDSGIKADFEGPDEKYGLN